MSSAVSGSRKKSPLTSTLRRRCSWTSRSTMISFPPGILYSPCNIRLPPMQRPAACHRKELDQQFNQTLLDAFHALQPPGIAFPAQVQDNTKTTHPLRQQIQRRFDSGMTLQSVQSKPRYSSLSRRIDLGADSQ